MAQRIMLVASTLRMGGAERGTLEIMRRLHRTGSTVETICLREAGVIGEMLEREGIRVVADLSPGARDPRGFLRLYRFFRDRGARAVYFLDHTNAVAWGAPAARAAGVPVRLMVMHTTGLWGGGSSLPVGVRLAIPSLSRVIATARGQAGYLRELGVPAHKLVTIRNGVDTTGPLSKTERRAIRAELGLAADDVAVGMVAMLRPEKSHETLFHAVARLKDDNPRLRVLLVGDGPRREELVTEAARLGLTGIVRFLGLRPDAPRLVGAFDVVVLTSLPLVETLPYSLLEAIAQGVPAIATRVGSLDEIVEQGGAGLLVPPGDPDAFATALGTVLADPALRADLGERGRRWIEREFSVERVVGETQALIDELDPGT